MLVHVIGMYDNREPQENSARASASPQSSGSDVRSMGEFAASAYVVC